MGQEIKAQTLNSKYTDRSLFHLLAQIPQMKDLIFIVKIFQSNTTEALSPKVPIHHQLNLFDSGFLLF